MRATAAAERSWCEATLGKVSRTFALCIRFLPGEVRLPVLLSYLLCRIADTIEDSPELAVDHKQRLLAAYAASLDDGEARVAGLTEAFGDVEGAEADLARQAHRVLAVFGELERPVRAEITPWVTEMCRGMSEFSSLRTGTRPSLRALPTEADLDRYCYYVAGTVGHLLTGLFGRLRPRVTTEHLARLDPLAESFGAGLQLTNIIVDAGVDHGRGVSYVPEDLCRREGLVADDLLRPRSHRAARRVFGHLIAKARGHLEDALHYCEHVPRVEYQIRLFCLVPVFLAIRTLRAVEASGEFPARDLRVKITRGEVYRTVTAARLCASSNSLTRVYAQHLSF